MGKRFTTSRLLSNCRIGVREGYGTLIITDALKDKNYFHVGIDPYGDLLYKHIDKQIDQRKEPLHTGKILKAIW